jgi:hypothetical protein
MSTATATTTPLQGKVLAQRNIRELESGEEPELQHDRSTNAPIRRYGQMW